MLLLHLVLATKTPICTGALQPAETRLSGPCTDPYIACVQVRHSTLGPVRQKAYTDRNRRPQSPKFPLRINTACSSCPISLKARYPIKQTMIVLVLVIVAYTICDCILCTPSHCAARKDWSCRKLSTPNNNITQPCANLGCALRMRTYMVRITDCLLPWCGVFRTCRSFRFRKRFRFCLWKCS